jgi:hypothetical protein
MIETEDDLTAGEAMKLWAGLSPRCACCWIDHRKAERERWPGIQVHHIIKRSRHRCDEPWNLLRLCERCHRLAEGETIRDRGVVLPKLSLGHTLWLKFVADPHEWEPEKMAAIYHRELPPLLGLPDAFQAERYSHKPMIDWRDLA